MAVIVQARRRRDQRGASVLVVVLLISLLMGIGMFAARSASLATAASGYDRQQTQTHYFTNYAVSLAANELSTDRASAYVTQMAHSPDVSCRAISTDPSNPSAARVSNGTCYRFGYEDVGKVLGLANLVEPAVAPAPGVAPVPGSLGRAQLKPDFVIEMTDLAPASPPVPGSDLSSSGAASVTYMTVTLNASGRIQPQNTGTVRAGQSAGAEQSRAHLVIGPLPKL